MSGLLRFGISLPKDLLEKFDKLIKAKNYSNRSEAFRDLIRQELVKEEWQAGTEVVGAVTWSTITIRESLLINLPISSTIFRGRSFLLSIFI